MKEKKQLIFMGVSIVLAIALLLSLIGVATLSSKVSSLSKEITTLNTQLDKLGLNVNNTDDKDDELSADWTITSTKGDKDLSVLAKNFTKTYYDTKQYRTPAKTFEEIQGYLTESGQIHLKSSHNDDNEVYSQDSLHETKVYIRQVYTTGDDQIIHNQNHYQYYGDTKEVKFVLVLANTLVTTKSGTKDTILLNRLILVRDSPEEDWLIDRFYPNVLKDHRWDDFT